MRVEFGQRGGKLAACGVQDYVGDIRAMYTRDFNSKQLLTSQMAVALYFIDKLALRAGHEKDEDEADTVGCCTLKASPSLAGADWLAQKKLFRWSNSRTLWIGTF